MQIGEDDRGQYAARLNEALRLIMARFHLDTFAVKEVMGPFLLLVFGRGQPLIKTQDHLIVSQDEGQAQLAALSTALLQELRGTIRILMGDAEASVGSFGTDSYIRYGAQLDHFGEMISHLQTVAYGASRQWTQAARQ